VIFIHGHAFNEENTPEASTAAFAKIQEKMQEEGFIDAGQLDLSSISEDLSKCSAPAAFRATYYYTPYFSLGDYKVTVQKSERIENYALRLKEIIDFVKQKTGREKVTIIAHSMGGLVLREYVSLFGADDLDKAILINAPNHGVSGKVEKYCSVIGASKECEDLSSGSVFLSKLNVMPLSPEVAAKFYNIISTGCEMDDGKEGDGIVTKDSAYLESGKNYFIRGQCTDALKTNLHNEILEPGKYPQTYQLFLQILRE
jgi:hypothetical protein